jgi:hypothetical protein
VSRAEIPGAPQAIEAMEHAHDNLRSLLSNPQGRELAVWLVVDVCGAFNLLEATIGNTSATAYAAGRRDAGLKIKEHLELADGAGWDRAISERRASLQQLAGKREKKLAKAAAAEKDDEV